LYSHRRWIVLDTPVVMRTSTAGAANPHDEVIDHLTWRSH